MIVKREIERLEKGINDGENLLYLNTLGETNDLKKNRLELKTFRRKSKRCFSPSKDIFHQGNGCSNKVLF